MTTGFMSELMKIGILSYNEQETLFQIAKRCARTAGVPTAAAGGLLMASAGTVVIPGVGAVPGYIAGALAGMLAGTMSCTALNVSARQQLKALAEGASAE